MKIQAIIASLVLGSSSLAMATPAVIEVRDHRPLEPAQPVYAAPAQPIHAQPIAWHQPVFRSTTLASGLRLSSQGRATIAVGRQAGTFGALAITEATGRTLIKQVTVQFADGQQQVIRNLNRALAANETLRLDLDGGRRAIRSIVVYGNDLASGRRRDLAAFTLTAS